MATFLFANNAQTRLAGPITSTATTCNVAAGTGALFPQPGNNQFFALTLLNAASATAGPQGTIWEIVYVTAVTGDTLTITRAQEGTQAEAWNAGDIAANLVTAGALRAFAQAANLSSSFFQGTDTSGDPNNMTVTATVPANNAPTAGQTFLVTKDSQVNTGNMTLLTPSAGTRAPVINADGSQIPVGGWPGNASAFLVFTGTVYQLTGPLVLLPINDSRVWHLGTATATAANVYAATLAPVPQSGATNFYSSIAFPSANTGPATLNGASIVVDATGNPLVGGEIPTINRALIFYDGNVQRLLNPVARTVPTSAKVFAAFQTTTTSPLTILNSLGVASIAQTGTNAFRATFSTPFVDANYTVLGTACTSTPAGNNGIFEVNPPLAGLGGNGLQPGYFDFLVSSPASSGQTYQSINFVIFKN